MPATQKPVSAKQRGAVAIVKTALASAAGTLLTRVSWSQHCEDADLRALGIGGAAQQCLIDGGGPGGVRLDLRYLCALGRRRGDSAREQVDGASGQEALAMDHHAAAARAAGRSENQRWRGGDSLHAMRRDRDNQGRDNDEQSDKQQAMLGCSSISS